MVYLIGGVFGLIILIAYLIGHFAYENRSRRKPELGFPYVQIEDDGTARELTDDEREYLSTEFIPTDSGRPYIKSNYEAKTPDGRLVGFLERRQLPQNIGIKPAPDTKEEFR